MREADGSGERGGLGLGHETGGAQVLDKVPEARVNPHLGKEHQRDRHQEPDVGVDAGEERAGLARAGSHAFKHHQAQEGQPREKRQRETEADGADRPAADPDPSHQAVERAALHQRELRHRRIDGLPGGGHHRVIIERSTSVERNDETFVGQCFRLGKFLDDLDDGNVVTSCEEIHVCGAPPRKGIGEAAVRPEFVNALNALVQGSGLVVASESDDVQLRKCSGLVFGSELRRCLRDHVSEVSGTDLVGSIRQEEPDLRQDEPRLGELIS